MQQRTLVAPPRTAAYDEPAFPNTQRKVGSTEVLAEYSKKLQRINFTIKKNVRNILLFLTPLGQHCRRDLAVHFTPLLCAHANTLF